MIYAITRVFSCNYTILQLACKQAPDLNNNAVSLLISHAGRDYFGNYEPPRTPPCESRLSGSSPSLSLSLSLSLSHTHKSKRARAPFPHGLEFLNDDEVPLLAAARHAARIVSGSRTGESHVNVHLQVQHVSAKRAETPTRADLWLRPGSERSGKIAHARAWATYRSTVLCGFDDLGTRSTRK